MKLSIYSIKEILFQGEANSLNCKTEMGEVTILDKHEPLISVISKGAMKIVDSLNQEKYFNVKSGFLQVMPGNEVRCIVE